MQRLEIIARIVNMGIDLDEVAYFNNDLAEKLTAGIRAIDPAILEEPGIVVAIADMKDKSSQLRTYGLSEAAADAIHGNMDRLMIGGIF